MVISQQGRSHHSSVCWGNLQGLFTCHQILPTTRGAGVPKHPLSDMWTLCLALWVPFALPPRRTGVGWVPVPCRCPHLLTVSSPHVSLQHLKWCVFPPAPLPPPMSLLVALVTGCLKDLLPSVGEWFRGSGNGTPPRLVKTAERVSSGGLLCVYDTAQGRPLLCGPWSVAQMAVWLPEVGVSLGEAHSGFTWSQQVAKWGWKPCRELRPERDCASSPLWTKSWWGSTGAQTGWESLGAGGARQPSSLVTLG